MGFSFIFFMTLSAIKTYIWKAGNHGKERFLLNFTHFNQDYMYMKKSFPLPELSYHTK